MAGLTKQQGQSTHNYRYDAYGQLLPAKGNWTDPHNHYTFSAKEWDEHLDSYEFGYRQYDPAAGVWLTQDPLRGEPQRPRTLHRYQYVFASPISYRDAYGLWPAWLDQTAQSVAQGVSSAAESVTTTVNNARQSAAAWCNDHEEVVQAAIIGAAVVAATAVTVATAGAGAPLGAMIVGATVAGATGAGAVTLARNAIDENRPWHEDVGESLQAGAAIGFGIGGIGATIAAVPAALAWGGQVGASTGVVASSLGASAGVASFAGSVASVAAPGGFLLGTGGFYGAASSSLNPYFSPQSRARAGNVALLSGSLGMLSYYGGETLNAWGMRLSCAQPGSTQQAVMRGGVVYRAGSRTPKNLTPRPGVDTTGLSTFDSLERAAQPGQKAQVIDVSLLQPPLQAVPDAPPPGHVSITPSDSALIEEWAATRGTSVIHPLTQNIMDAITGVVRRPK